MLDFARNGHNHTAQQSTVEDFTQNIDGQTDFSFPVIGNKLQDSYKGGLGYAPFVESAGVAFIVYTDTSNVKEAMFSALLASWPVVAIPLIMAFIAGFLVWVLVGHLRILFISFLRWDLSQKERSWRARKKNSRAVPGGGEWEA